MVVWAKTVATALFVSTPKLFGGSTTKYASIRIVHYSTEICAVLEGLGCEDNDDGGNEGGPCVGVRN